MSFLDDKLSLKFSGEFTLYTVDSYQKNIDKIDFSDVCSIEFDLEDVVYFDTAASIFINSLIQKFKQKNIKSNIITNNRDILDTLELVEKSKRTSQRIPDAPRTSILELIGKRAHWYY
ncbi:MAG: STAS domain-containing protein, partial [Campylobacterota bacterium]|nr:STAS domain-containing protein [Campylobacterota bacterium]